MAIVEQEGGAVLETPEIAALIRVRDAYQSGEIRWIRGSLEDGSGGYCLRGALHNWLGAKQGASEDEVFGANHLLDVHFRQRGEFDVSDSVEAWNDNVARTRDQVIEKLDEIIAEAREGEQACRS